MSRAGLGFTLPFLMTSPRGDVAWALRLAPVWWLLGLEQFIWTLLFALSAAKVVRLRRGWVVVHPATALLAIFFSCACISGLFIEDSFRYITFTRNLMVYLAVTLLVFVVTNEVEARDQAVTLMGELRWMFGASCLAGWAGSAGLLDGGIPSVAGLVMPGSIRGTHYGQLVAVRSVGNHDWFSLLGSYFRQSGTFLFATMYSAALAIVLPLVVGAVVEAPTRRARALRCLGLAALVSGLVATTGRTSTLSALVGVTVGGGLRLWFHRRRAAECLGLATMLAAGLFLVAGPMVTEADLGEGVRHASTKIAEGRGGGSLGARLYIYEQTLIGWTERPLFGWGTQRDLPNFAYPAGSHSTYLGYLYKHGAFGLLAFLGAVAALLVCAWPGRAQGPADPVLCWGVGSLVAGAANMMTDVFDLDAQVAVVFWLVGSCLLARTWTPTARPAVTP